MIDLTDRTSVEATESFPEHHANIRKKLFNLEKTTLGGYKIEQLISSGGMGVVYQGVDKTGKQKVAVKILFPELYNEEVYIERFKREINSIKILKNKHVVKGIDSGIDGGLYYFVMEFIDGESLQSMLKNMESLMEDEVVEIGLQVAKALDHANKFNIIHRDIKPGNIMISHDNIVKITDFGLSKNISDPSLTTGGMILGTFNYISPEQAQGYEEIDYRSDMYSMGVTLFNALTGQLPFKGQSPGLVRTKHVTDPVPYVSDVNKEISDNLSAVINRMVQKAKENRYPDYASLIEDLERVKNGEKPLKGLYRGEDTHRQLKLQETIVEQLPNDIKDGLKNYFTNLEDITSHGFKTVKYPEESVLFYEEEVSDEVYILISGKLEVMKSGVHLDYIEKAYTFVGEMSGLLGVSRSATVRTVNQSTLMRIDHDKLKEFLKTSPELGFNLASDLAERLVKSNHKYQNLKKKLDRGKKDIEKLLQQL